MYLQNAPFKLIYRLLPLVVTASSTILYYVHTIRGGAAILRPAVLDKEFIYPVRPVAVVP